MVNIGGGFSIFLYQQLSNIKVIYYFYEKLLNMSRIQDLKKIGDANINIIDLLSMFNEIICRHNSMPILLSGISEYALCAVIDQKHLHQTMISLHSELIDQ